MLELSLPPWLQTVIASILTGAIVGALGWLFGRRLSNATAGEKDANTAQIMSNTAASLAERLAAAMDLNLVGKQKIIEQEEALRTQGRLCLLAENLARDRMDKIIELEGQLADANAHEPLGLETAKMLRQQAEIIVDCMGHLTYIPSPGEQDDSLPAQWMRGAKAAAQKIVGMKL